MGKGNSASALPWVKQPKWFGLQWPGKQMMVTPRQEITAERFLELLGNGAEQVTGISYDQVFVDWDGSIQNDRANPGALYSINYWFYYTFGLALARNHNTNQVRYFRIGCEHKNTIRTNPQMFKHVRHCPDCELDMTYWSD